MAFSDGLDEKPKSPKILSAARKSTPLHSASQDVGRSDGRRPFASGSPETRCGPRWLLYEQPHPGSQKRCKSRIRRPPG